MWSDLLFGYRVGSFRGDLTFDRRDSARAMPKGVGVDDSFNWGDDRPPLVPRERTVIYEAHLRGLTCTHEVVPPRERGTFAALANPRAIEHLHRLGITAIELLPVHAFMQDRCLVARRLRNYWSYSTLAYFAPEPRHLVEPWLQNQVKVAVRRLHAAGIEVILDVVYNHTCEGNEIGPMLSWRGLDNASYYRLVPGMERRTSMTPALATRSTSPTRECCKWLWTVCVIGWSATTSTDFVPISAWSWDANQLASIAARAFSMRCVKTRCCPG